MPGVRSHFYLLIAARKIRGLWPLVSVMSSSSGQAKLLFGFEPVDWLFLAGGVALTAVVAAVLAF